MRKLEVIILTIACLVTLTVSSSAQEKFDAVTFTAPKGWQKSVETNAIQFTKQNGNQIAIMMLFKSIPTAKDSKTTFDTSWNSIVKELLTKVDAPKMQPAIDKNGWTIESGVAIGEKDGEKVAAMLLSATGGGKVVNLLVLFNSEVFQPEVERFVSSIDLKKITSSIDVPTKQSGTINNSIVGLWGSYLNETSGYINGMPQYTAGYFRREYLFKADGTYLFKVKNWSVLQRDILFITETGTWAVNGNKLAISPKQGKGEWWSKAASGRTTEWGSFVKLSEFKPEAVTYTFELRYFEGQKETHLLLESGKSTERDGTGSNNSFSWSYSPRALDKSLIDNPPSRR